MKQFIQIGKNIYYIFTMSKRTKGQRVPTSNYLVLKKIAHPNPLFAKKWHHLAKEITTHPKQKKKKNTRRFLCLHQRNTKLGNRAVYTFNVENLI